MSLSAALLLMSGTGAASTTDARTIAIVDATVLTMTAQGRLAHRTVIVRDGAVVAIGAAKTTKSPRGATIVDGRTRFLMPGLSDMHAHLFRWTPPADAPRDAADRAARVELLAYLATGVTVVRDMSGTPMHLRYRGLLARGAVTGPRMWDASPILEGARPVWSWSTHITDPARADALIAGFAAQGYDFVKAYHTLSAPVYRAVVAAAAKRRLRVVGHVPFEIGIEGALAAGQSSVEHLRGYDFDGMSPAELEADGGRSPARLSRFRTLGQARLRELVALTVRAGTWNVPTLAIDEFLADPARRDALRGDPAFPLLPPRARESLAPGPLDDIYSPAAKAALGSSLPRHREFVRMLHDAGAGLLIGTDSPAPFLVHGFTPIDEIEQFVRAGIPAEAVFRIATVDAARFLGVEDSYGSIAVGRRPDMILLDADPVADPQNLWRLRGVVSHGRWLTAVTLRRRIALQQPRPR